MKRRSAMQLIVLGSAAAPPVDGQQHAAGHSVSAAAGAGPAMKLKFFTPAQNALVDQLAEMIIPADAHSPGAHEARVSEFIDDLLAGSPPALQQQWTSGMAAVNAEANRRHAKPFLQCAATQRDAILKDMANGEESPKTELHRFFIALKRQTISGYYTSSIGLLKDLQYKGIVPIAAYPPCDHPDHQKRKQP